MTIEQMNGRCVCGATEFSAKGIEEHFHACHCGTCRRWCGGPMMAASVQGVAFSKDDHLVRFDSSEWGARGFCGACGSNLFFYVKPTGQYLVSLGAFEDSTPFSLGGEIFVDHQPKGYAFQGDHSRMTEAEFLAKFAG